MPDTLVDTDILRAAVQLACRAPSLHNSQPWQWVAEGAGLHLYVDRSRILPSTDKSGREAHIGCGAVLDHLRVAMAAAGWTANVDRFPDPNNLDHLASLDFSPMSLVTDGHRRRADAILHRRTDRLPFAAPRNWESLNCAAQRRRCRHSSPRRDSRRDAPGTGQGVTTYLIAATLRFLVSHRIKLVDWSFREFGWDSAEFTVVGGRK